MRTLEFSKEFKKYILPIVNAPCEKTYDGYLKRMNKVQYRLRYVKIENMGAVRIEEVGFNYGEHYQEYHKLTWDERHFLYKFYCNSEFNAMRAKNNWFFKRKGV